MVYDSWLMNEWITEQENKNVMYSTNILYIFILAIYYLWIYSRVYGLVIIKNRNNRNDDNSNSSGLDSGDYDNDDDDDNESNSFNINNNDKNNNTKICG